MLSFFEDRKKDIREFLAELFERKRDEFSRINHLGGDLCGRLYNFSIQGKMIRGGLVSLGYSLFRGWREEDKSRLVAAGAAMELFQSALLVHDDIMDRDTTRRGLSSIFYQYAKMADHQGMAESYHVGESLGICAGDVAFFLAFEILAGLEVKPETYKKILALVSREIGYVGIAQMQDLYNGASPARVTDSEILKLYLYKTGRYTFSLPLMIGGLLAGADEGEIDKLAELGEETGIVFQIRDDELGLFGEDIGKPVGSDIREGKKTLFYGYLQEFTEKDDRDRLNRVFGSDDITEEDVRFVQRLTEDTGVRDTVRGLARSMADKAFGSLNSLVNVEKDYKGMLEGLLNYTLARSH